MAKIIIIGAGAMGSAFSIPCIDNGNDVTLFGTHLENDLIDKIKKGLHPSLKIALPRKLKIEKTEKLIKHKDPDIIICAVSSQGIDWFINQASEIISNKTQIILLTKGLKLENEKLLTISDKIESELKRKGFNGLSISAIKGPCLAAGLAHKMRTSTVIANQNVDIAKKLKDIIQTNYYSTEISTDLKGVEICGAIKNIYSMLIGASEGLSNPITSDDIRAKFFLNTSASLIHRSISEMVKFVTHFGGKSETVFGLAGLGDLYVSAIGGRNSLMGKYLGQGKLYNDIKEKEMKGITVEGAQLILEIGDKIVKDLNNKDYPLMFSLVNTICRNQKLLISW